MRLTDCHNFHNFLRLAKKRLPGPFFNYIDGAADDEATYRRNSSSFDEGEFTVSAGWWKDSGDRVQHVWKFPASLTSAKRPNDRVAKGKGFGAGFRPHQDQRVSCRKTLSRNDWLNLLVSTSSIATNLVAGTRTQFHSRDIN